MSSFCGRKQGRWKPQNDWHSLCTRRCYCGRVVLFAWARAEIVINGSCWTEKCYAPKTWGDVLSCGCNYREKTAAGLPRSSDEKVVECKKRFFFLSVSRWEKGEGIGENMIELIKERHFHGAKFTRGRKRKMESCFVSGSFFSLWMIQGGSSAEIRRSSKAAWRSLSPLMSNFGCFKHGFRHL